MTNNIIKKKPAVRIFLFLFVLINSQLSAQNILQYYLNAAFQNNPSIKENINNIQIRNLDRSLNNAQFNLPQVSLTANYLFAPYFNNNPVVTTSPDSKAIGYDASITNGGLYSAQVNVSRNIFNGGLLNAYDAQTGLQIRSSENNIDVTKHTLERDITDQYLVSLQAQQLYKLSRTMIDTLKQQLNITRSLMLKGLVKETDYLLLKVELANEQIASGQAFSLYKSSLYELNSLCGLADTSTVELKEIELTRSSAVNESNFLRQYSLDSMLVVSQQNITETKYLPQCNIFANAGLNAVELTGIERKFGMSAGFNFSLPIFDGNQKGITRQQSEISARIIGEQKENQKVILQNKKNEISGQIENYSHNMRAISAQLNDYTNVIRLSHSELIHGQMNMVEFLTILRNFLELKKNEIQTYTAYQQMINQFNYWNW
ncbi:MAG: TolC family protein [Bacteroidota bacterium]|nr:TolC family protein [Bacteroidota bacterium]